MGDFETTERSLLPAAEALERTAFPMHLRPLLARAARIDPRLATRWSEHGGAP